MSANWCCHCGYMLPFGRKNSVKCSECSITCHQTCSHLVPDFCGMTMEMANILLKNLRDIKTTQVHKKPTPPSITSGSSSVSTLPLYQGPPSQQVPPERPAHPQALPPPQQQAPPRPAPPPGAYSPADNRHPGPTAQPYPPAQPYGQEQGGQRPGPGGGRPMPQPPVNQHRLSYEKPHPQPAPPQVRHFCPFLSLY